MADSKTSGDKETNMDFKGKSAVITGAARGIGKAYAKALLDKGCKVCLSDINVKKGEETCQEFQTVFGTDNIIFAKCDVTSDKEVQGLMAFAVEKFKNIDIMINNAGIMDESKPFLTIDINLNGVIRGTSVALEHMRRDKGGRGGAIVNISSIAALHPVSVLPTYSAAKLGIIGYSKSWAAHPEVINNGIKIVCICPGLVDTDILNVTENMVEDYNLYVELKNTYELMQPSEVGKALIKVLQDEDNNGCCLKVDKKEDLLLIYV